MKKQISKNPRKAKEIKINNLGFKFRKAKDEKEKEIS